MPRCIITKFIVMRENKYSQSYLKNVLTTASQYRRTELHMGYHTINHTSLP